MAEHDAVSQQPEQPRARWWWRCGVLVGLVVLCVLGLLIAFIINDRLLPVASESELRGALTRNLAEAQAAYTALDALWSTLERGGAVDCGEQAVERPYFVAWRSRDREAYPALAAQADMLNGAIRALHRTADAWTTACQSGTGGIASDEAVEARAALDRAAIILTELAGRMS